MVTSSSWPVLGNLQRRIRLSTHRSTASLFRVDRLMAAARTLPSRATPSSTHTFPESSGLFARAFYYIDPAFMILLSKSSLLWITGFSLIFFPKEWALVKSRVFWAGLALSVVGVVGVLCFKEGFAATRTLTGIVLVLSMAVMWAVYTLSAKIVFKDIDSRQGFSVITIYTVAGLAVPAFWFGDLGRCAHMGLPQWGIVVLSGITSIAFAHVLYYTAMRHIGATIPALIVLAQPFTILPISHMVFDESLNIRQMLFGVILLLGSALAIWAQQHLKHQKGSHLEL